MTKGTHSDAVTRGIRVEVQSFYEAERSSEDESYYFFAYRVTISNEGDVEAKLLSREWIITDSDGEERRVVGPGVVGEQPTLAPGAKFEYTSFCPLSTQVGSMHGSYRMITADGETFEATIAPFTLSVPHAVN